MKQKLQRLMYDISISLELIVGVILIIGILVAATGMFDELKILFDNRLDTNAFSHFLHMALNIVIGIEFLKMLCRHNLSSVVEVLLFTVARHMVATDTSSLENLFTVIAVAVLFCIRKWLFIPNLDNK